MSRQQQAWSGKTVVVKLGGSAMGDKRLEGEFIADIAHLASTGVRVVVVHGGGPQIDTMLTRLGIASERIGGFRVTTPEVLDVVRMVLTGQVRPNIVNALNTAGTSAIGMSGEDGRTIRVRRRKALVDGQPADLGLVGEVEHIDTAFLTSVIDAGHVPVVSSIGADRKGVAYNLNADTVAAAIANDLRADRLILMTDVAGLHPNWPDTTTVIDRISADELSELLPTLDGGMAPKVEACLAAVADGGAHSAQIVDGRVPHAVRNALDGQISLGTMVLGQ